MPFKFYRCNKAEYCDYKYCMHRDPHEYMPECKIFDECDQYDHGKVDCVLFRVVNTTDSLEEFIKWVRMQMKKESNQTLTYIKP